MKKKGFTLVELLAVIAILAILVIIALPNIMDLFNQAKKNSFENEVKEIYKTAQSQWLVDSMSGASERIYGRGDFEDYDCSANIKPLSLSGRENIQYSILFDTSGNVTRFYATDSTYKFVYYNQSDFLKVEDIGKTYPIEPSSTSECVVHCDEIECF